MRNVRIGLIGWLLAGAVAAVGSLIGFVWLPSLQASALGIGVWDAICRAAGITRPVASIFVASSPSAVPTNVIWNAETLHAAVSGDAQRARAVVLGCAGCHGVQGVSPSEAFPNLAGLSKEDMYKALKDYRDGKRQNATMQGIAEALDDQKIADIAAHYASLTSKPRHSAGAPRVVAFGNPSRSIAPCAACHGPIGRKDGAPSLEGQKRDYLRAQLEAFATGSRRNDMNQQMREIARALTPAERDAVAEWYENPGISNGRRVDIPVSWPDRTPSR
jgi:cytochrome c553